VAAVASPSVASPILTPPISAASFVPVMVIVTVRSVPSADTAVNVSVVVSPSPSAWTVGFELSSV